MKFPLVKMIFQVKRLNPGCLTLYDGAFLFGENNLLLHKVSFQKSCRNLFMLILSHLYSSFPLTPIVMSHTMCRFILIPWIGLRKIQTQNIKTNLVGLFSKIKIIKPNYKYNFWTRIVGQHSAANQNNLEIFYLWYFSGMSPFLWYGYAFQNCLWEFPINTPFIHLCCISF